MDVEVEAGGSIYLVKGAQCCEGNVKHPGDPASVERNWQANEILVDVGEDQEEWEPISVAEWHDIENTHWNDFYQKIREKKGEL